MSEPYLLAASLLAGLVVPTSTLPRIVNLPDNSLSLPLVDLAKSFQSDESEKISHWQVAVPEFTNDTQKSVGKGKSFAKVDNSLPQFSEFPEQQLSVITKNIPNPGILWSEFRQQHLSTVKSSFNFNSQPTNSKTKLPISGSQLYYQRLAFLRSGQIYTRTDNEENLESSWESNKTHQPTYQDWKSLLAMEAKAISKGQGVNRLSILVGDSLSLWFPKEKLPVGKLWLNQGISGDTSQGLLKRLSAFSATRPDVIYVMIGINDLRKGATNQSILVNSHSIIRNLRQAHPNSQIIVQSILPVRSQKISNTRIRHINDQLAIIAKRQGVNFVNIHNWFTDINGNLRPELTTDGLHLSPAGYQIWQFALEQIEYDLTQTYQKIGSKASSF